LENRTWTKELPALRGRPPAMLAGVSGCPEFYNNFFLKFTMRYQGRITDWKDEKGFGFITPNGGGNQVFAHIKSFSNRQRRPAGNELVTYELKLDEKGRARAESISFVGAQVSEAVRPGRGNIAPAFAVLFCMFVAASVLSGRLPHSVLWVYLGTSVIAFIAYALDKSAAVNDRWRTQESTLHMFSLIGGWPGALAAQRLLRHKSKKASFQGAFWTTVAINCIGFGWFLSASVS